MDSSNPYSGDQDSVQPGPGRGDGGQFWPPGQWQRPAQLAVGLGVAAAVLFEVHLLAFEGPPPWLSEEG